MSSFLEPEITTDTNIVVSSGLILTFENEETIFEFPVASGNLILRIRFVTDSSKQLSMRTVNLDKKTLLLELTNFDNPMGAGNVVPIRLGNIDGKNLSINISVKRQNLETQIREFAYTFYLEK